jgi:hypothetical protein
VSEHLVNMPLVEAENEVQGVGVTELAENRISVCIRKIDMIPGAEKLGTMPPAQKSEKKGPSAWKAALADAELQMQGAKDRVRRLTQTKAL